MENVDPPLPPPPKKKIKDGKMARFCPSCGFIFDLRGGGGSLFHFILSKIVATNRTAADEAPRLSYERHQYGIFVVAPSRWELGTFHCDSAAVLAGFWLDSYFRNSQDIKQVKNSAQLTVLKHAASETCSGRWRRGWKIQLSYLRNNQPFSMQLRPYSFRQLCGKYYGPWVSNHGVTLGYSRPRGLRSSETALVPPNRCIRCVFRCGKSKFFSERVREMGSRGSPFCSRSGSSALGDQDGSS